MSRQMKIVHKPVTIRALVEGYSDNGDDGVVGYGGKLDIRPPYQRAFIYNDQRKTSVINSVLKGYPLNAMYWAQKQGGGYEVLDGQQRTVSICQYRQPNGFSVPYKGNPTYYDRLPGRTIESILDYELNVYICDADDEDKLDWFKIINLAGLELTNQELLNAIYHGEWLTAAKKYFSRKNYGADQRASQYMKGRVDRQEFLEVAIKWACFPANTDIACYMSDSRKNKTDATELIKYFEDVVEWVEFIFTVKRPKIMQGVNWGKLYAEHKGDVLDAADIERQIQNIMADNCIEKKTSGIYPYILTREKKYLTIRGFPDHMKEVAYNKQNGKCARCKKPFEPREMHGDHIRPWSKDGETNQANCQLLCGTCNGIKSDK